VETIRHEVWINASRNTVFKAITSREGLDAWWGKVVNTDPQVGSMVEFDHGLGDLLRMRIIDLVPDDRLGSKCVSDFSEPSNPASEWLGTRLFFELADGERTGFEPIDSHITRDRLTILRFRHTGWPSESRWFGYCNYAWGVTLEGLANYCEKEESSDPGEHQ